MSLVSVCRACERVLACAVHAIICGEVLTSKDTASTMVIVLAIASLDVWRACEAVRRAKALW